MALSIKDAETDRLVRRYAKLRGTSYTAAIRHAVSDALTREGDVAEAAREARVAAFMQAVREVQQVFANAPILDPRTPDEILYDDDGLPH